MSVTVLISENPVTIAEGSLSIPDKVDERGSCSFTVIDSAGTALFQKGQPVAVNDSLLGPRFSGFITQPGPATSLYPNPGLRWPIVCADQTYPLDNRTSQKSYSNQYAGTIVVDQVQRFAPSEGVFCRAALRWDELLSDWEQGLLTNTAATTNASDGNAGDGDLELARAGSTVSFQQQSQADFNAGVTGHGLSSPASGGVTFTPTQAIALTATESLPGVASAALTVKIWSGSYTIAASDTLYFDVWISDSCPQQMATLDLVFSDGTRLSASQSTVGVDLQGVGPGITNDLSGLATNTWYSRRFFLDGGGVWVGKVVAYAAVCFGGTSQGNYTAYFRNISIQNGSTTKLTIFGSTATATQTTPQPVQNSGYTNISCAVVTSYERHGSMYSPQYDLTGAGIANSSQLTWSITLPSSDFTYSVTVSIDGFATFLPCTQNAAIPGLLAGMNLSGIKLQLVYTFDNSGNDPTLTPLLSTITGTINPSYACSKSDIVNTMKGTWSSGTLTNLNLSGSNTLQLNGYARNWDNADYSNQTLYGTASPAQGIQAKQFYLTTGTGTDARSRLDFAGSGWQNFTAEVDVIIPAAGGQAGFVYRTTGWQSGNNTFAYSIVLSTNQIQLGKGTNSSSGSGTFTTLSTASVTLSAGTAYRLKIIINGTSHQAYINDVLYINTTDSTYTAAGYLGLRFYNAVGSTQTALFDNFGVMLALSGTWVSPAIDIHALSTISNSQIILQIDPAVNTSITTFLVEISLDNGSTWTSCSNTLATPVVIGEGYFQSLPVPGLSPGTNVSSLTQIKLRLTISSSTAATAGLVQAAPDIQAVSFFAIGAFSSTGTRSTSPLAWDSMQRANVASGFGTATNGATYIQTGTGTTNLTSDEAQIANTTGDVHMQIGSTTGTDLDGTVRLSLSASTMSAGMELRYGDANDFYRFSVTTTTITLVKVSGGFSITLATASLTLSTGTFYWMRFRVVGSAPVQLYGRVWQDGSAEPSAWNITASDE